MKKAVKLLLTVEYCNELDQQAVNKSDLVDKLIRYWIEHPSERKRLCIPVVNDDRRKET
jgi:hypothetical protein